MARQRIIKPTIYGNEEIAQLPFEGRWLFTGLWTMADCDGRLEDRPMRIKAHVFPHDQVDVSPLLTRLEEVGFIIRYQVDGVKCIQINNFRKHQKPHPKEERSSLPDLPEQNTAKQCLAVARQEQAVEKNGETLAGKPFPSIPSIPSSPSLPSLDESKDSSSPSGGVCEEPEAKEVELEKKPRKQINYEPAFEELWSIYPKRPGQPLHGKPATYKRWKSFALEERPEILLAAKNYAKRCGDYARDPERFLKEDFWRSYLTLPDFATTTNVNRPSRNGTGQLYRPP